jgi:5-oxopent-3-ene-1,2,5-tricarboxylate decarboxylase/2-hydroxyhepta-2,4-diene-1,7-dioate isomerase
MNLSVICVAVGTPAVSLGAAAQTNTNTNTSTNTLPTVTIWGPHYVIADIARHVTLLPGDVVLIGAPCHSRSVDAGQLVECEITGIGRVAGIVTAVAAPRASALGVGHAPADTPEVRRVAFGFNERVPERLKRNLRQTRERA